MSDSQILDTVDVRRHAGLYGLVSLGAAAIAGAYLWRGWTEGRPLAWVVGVLLALVSLVHVLGWADSRSPLMVADRQGLRLRSRRSWVGLPWESVHAVLVHPRAGLRDGHLDVTATADGVETTYEIPLGAAIATSHRDLESALSDQAVGRTSVDTVKPEAKPARVAAKKAERPLPPPPTVPEPAPEPARKRLVARVAQPLTDSSPARRAVRADVRRSGPATIGALALSTEPSVLPEIKELRGTEGRVGLVLEQPVPVAIASAPVEPSPSTPAPELLIGPRVTTARERLRLSVDVLAERTRIRPHVIEAIEVDDFTPCGGDFYARGHLRTLGRMLGIDPGPLVASYDARYASGPINPRAVFQAELASGPRSTIKLASGGPNWTALIAVVMALVIVWAVAHVVTSQPDRATGSNSAPALGSAPVDVRDPGRFAGLGAPTTNEILLRAQGPVKVRVRTSDGMVVWRATLRKGDVKELSVPGVAEVTTRGVGQLRARVNGAKAQLLGGSKTAETERLGRS